LIGKQHIFNFKKSFPNVDRVALCDVYKSRVEEGLAPKKPYQNHRALYHFRWFWDYSGGQLTNNHAHTISAFLLVMGVKAPTKVQSIGGRYTLEDDGETPDVQDVSGRGAASEEAQGGTGERFTTMSAEDQLFNANKRDWISCMKSRNKPICDLEGGHHTAVICNLANISLHLGGRTINWDPEKEVIVGDKEAAAMCVRPYRAPWDGILRSIVKV